MMSELEDLINDVNSLLEEPCETEAESEPREINIENDLDFLYEDDPSLHEGDDENSSFDGQATVINVNNLASDRSTTPPALSPEVFTTKAENSVTVKLKVDCSNDSVKPDAINKEEAVNIPSSSEPAAPELFAIVNTEQPNEELDLLSVETSAKCESFCETREPNYTSTPIVAAKNDTESRRFKRIPFRPISFNDTSIDDAMPDQNRRILPQQETQIGQFPPSNAEESYTSSIFEGYNQGKSDEEILEDDLLYGDLGSGGDGDPVNCFSEEDFDEISRRLLGEDNSPPTKRLCLRSNYPQSSADRDDSDGIETDDDGVEDVEKNPGVSRDLSPPKDKEVCIIKEDPGEKTVVQNPDIEPEFLDAVLNVEDSQSDESVICLGEFRNDPDSLVANSGKPVSADSHLASTDIAPLTATVPPKESPILSSSVVSSCVDVATEVSKAGAYATEVTSSLKVPSSDATSPVVTSEGKKSPAASSSKAIIAVEPDILSIGPPSVEAINSDSDGIHVEDFEDAEKRPLEKETIGCKSDSRTSFKGPRVIRVAESEVNAIFRWDTREQSSFIRKWFENNQDSDDYILSLLCPLSLERLHHPVKANSCLHVETLDISSLFIFKNVNIGDETCPLCRKSVKTFETDALVAEILSRTSATSVILRRDGTWDSKIWNELGSNQGDTGLSIVEEILPEIGPKVIQIYDEDGAKKTVKIENEDEMSRLVREKWKLAEFPKQDHNLTISNFRKRRLKKNGDLLVGRSLLERNEFALYRSAETELGMRARVGRKRKRTTDERKSDEEIIAQKCVDGVLERELEDVDAQLKQLLKHFQSEYEAQLQLCQMEQQHEVHLLDHRLKAERQPKEYMFRVGAQLRRKHDAQIQTLQNQHQNRRHQCIETFERRKRETEEHVRRNVTSTTRRGVPPKMRDTIAKHGKVDVDELMPALLCGGNEKIIKTTYLPIDILKSILIENDAYRKVYGFDDRVKKF